MKAPPEVDDDPSPLVIAALVRTGLNPPGEESPTPRWDRGFPCAVVAAWAARQVRLGRADARWLVELLGSVDAALRAETERLDAFLAAIGQSLDLVTVDSPSAVGARRDVERLVWFLALGVPDEDAAGPFPGLRRDPEHLRWATDHLHADLERTTGAHWELHIGADGLLHVELDGRRTTTDVGTTVDPDRMVSWADPPDVDGALRWETLEALFDPVQEVFYEEGLHLRCGVHGKHLFPCCGEWVCEDHEEHQFAPIGQLRPDTALFAP